MIRIKNFIFTLFPFLDNSIARLTWVKLQLSLIKSGESLLDAGAGECPYKKHCNHLKYSSQDFAKYDGIGDQVGFQTVKWDNSKIDIVGDIINIPVENQSFDNILCTEVIEHIPSPELAIKEFSRILKTGGKLILTAPFASYTHFSPYHFCTGFNRYWYEEMSKRYKFEIITIVPNGNFFNLLSVELLRFPLMVKKYTHFSLLSYLLYFFVIQAVVIVAIFSFFGKKSSDLATAGYHVVAIKR